MPATAPRLDRQVQQQEADPSLPMPENERLEKLLLERHKERLAQMKALAFAPGRTMWLILGRSVVVRPPKHERP